MILLRIALYEWLKRAVELMPQPVDNMPRVPLLVNLGRVQAIPFGNQVLNIAANTHRPAERDAYIVEVRNREFLHVDTVKAKGLVYTDPD